jgi:hypothetical protein
MFYCKRLRWLNGRDTNQPQEQAMRNPRPFVVIQNAKPLFTVYAYSLEQARALVAAKVAGETIVLPVSLSGASR